MSPGADEATFATLVTALDRFIELAPGNPSALPGLEGALEALFAVASQGGRAGLGALSGALSEREDKHDAIGSWLALVRLSLSRGSGEGFHDLLEPLDAAAAIAPARTAWLVSSEAARVVWRRAGALEAWARVEDLEIAPAEQSFQMDGPLALHAALIKLRLAAITGHWQIHDRLAEQILELWPDAEAPRSARVAAILADHDVLRGRYRDALERIDRAPRAARGDLRLALLCAKLHALVACAADLRKTGLRGPIKETFKAAREAARSGPLEGHAIAPDERRALLRRLDVLGRLAGVVKRKPSLSPALWGALRLEQIGRRSRDPKKRAAAFLRALIASERLILSARSIQSPEEWLKLRLLWCRLIVDLDDRDRFAACEVTLGQLAEEAASLGLDPLEMVALDQRAVLRARLSPPAWEDALRDAGAAAEIAARILAANARSSATATLTLDRALLVLLLPVFDRVIELLAEGALRIAAQDPSILSDGGRARPDASREQSVRGSFARFGRAIHDYAEQSQALALEEARRAFGGGAPVPHRFAVSAGPAPDGALERLQGLLRRGDAILQYYLVGSYLLVFSFGRRFFEWHIQDLSSDAEGLEGEGRARDAIERDLDALRGWICGLPAPDDEQALRRLCEILAPPPIVASLARAQIKNLRIVPHDVLYRVPFGRLPILGGNLAARFALSVHATGTLAAESARGLPGPRPRRVDMGFILGPDVRAEDEAIEIQRAVGEVTPLARVHLVDTASEGLDRFRERARDLRVLHFACHGHRARHRRPAYLSLGRAPSERLVLADVAGLDLRACALAVLQSCWTGWMEHRRESPVQGFPQAFCDAGVGAVIAPLAPVPQALVPVFAAVFYRVLRFLPADQALHRALSLLRRFAWALAAADPAAREALREHGSMDAFEYRYTGATNLRVRGGVIARLLGRLSFWVWLIRLRRSPGPPA